MSSSAASATKRGGVKTEDGEPSPVVKVEGGADGQANASGSNSNGSAGGQAANGRSASSAKRETSPPLPTTYRDIPLYSSTLDDWRYHLMRLASHAKVDPSDPKQFPFPVKLNRKWPPKLKDPLPRAGDPVIDQFGKPVMVPAQRRDPNQPKGPLTAAERKRIPLLWPGPDDEVDEVEELLSRLEVPKGPQADASLIGPSAGSNNATRAKAGLFQKRVREIHKASAAARRTHNEEALPWILEDYETGKEWESRRKESRRGMKALQQGIAVRRDGGQFPTLPREDASGDGGVKAEPTDANGQIIKAEEDAGVQDNHAPWIGKLEGEAHESGSTNAGGAMSHALFVFDERGAGGFRVVPVSRMYKFLQRPKHANKMTWEEVEKAYEMHQKARLGEGIGKWAASREGEASRAAMMARRAATGGGGGGGGGAGVKGEYGAGSSIYRHLVLPSSSSGGIAGYSSSQPSVSSIYNRDSSERRNQFVAVSGESKRGIRVKDEEGTYGEIDFEEDFADDEERNEGDDFAMGEEEARELEQKIKREMARVEEQQRAEEGDGDDDDLDDLFDDPRGRKRPGRGENDILTGSGKQMKKIMKALARREGTDLYEEDDEDRNPYLSEESDEGEESVMANPDEALRRVREDREREAREAAKNNNNQASTTNASTTNGANTAQQSKGASKEASRSGTPVPRSAGGPRSSTVVNQGGSHRPGAGHASVAQRATSPSAYNSRPGSRSGSPHRDMGGGGPSTPSLKRKSEMGSGGKGGMGSGAGGEGGKRIRTNTTGTAGSQPGSPGSASPRSGSPSRGSYSRAGSHQQQGAQAPLSDLEREIVQLVRDGKAKTTKELIAHFAARLNAKAGDGSIKKAFSEAASRVLITKKPEGTLAVRAGF